MTMARLRSLTLVILTIAFVFAIGASWTPSLWPFTLFSGVVLCLTSVWLVKRSQGVWKEPLPAALLIPLAIAGLGIAQLAAGATQSPWETRRVTLEWITHAAVALLAYLVAMDKRMRRRALRILVIGSGALAVLGTAQNYTAPGRVFWIFYSGYRDFVFGPFVYHTKLAVLAELAIPAALWLAAHERRRGLLYLSCAAALAGSVVAAASRGGMALILPEIVVTGPLAVRARFGRIEWRWMIAGAAMLAAAAAIFGIGAAGERLASDPARDIRLPILDSLPAMARTYWLFGCGTGAWSKVYPHFATFDVRLFINQAHCDWLQWLIEGGIALPVLSGLVVVVTLRACRREWWPAGVAVVLLHGAFDYPTQQTPALVSLLLAIWGAAVALPPRSVFRMADAEQMQDGPAYAIRQATARSAENLANLLSGNGLDNHL